MNRFLGINLLTFGLRGTLGKPTQPAWVSEAEQSRSQERRSELGDITDLLLGVRSGWVTCWRCIGVLQSGDDSVVGAATLGWSR
ncbi:hypothetical protein QBC34DRAFT_403885 [Podospora aff. communis PSN243]|uniref:Uncharacterized protein n=1 Tax=Podospora aff. communis PSN243 TaxID=3040156 RepID=A0AAV9GRH7_9PEZI|nr:hypothetical protein QBC34DRAFT_403885 [Podospora aff. communis PSN243]